MNILVVGGAGFIGSNLVEELVKEGNVTVLDNFLTGSVDNLRNVLEKVKLIETSCRDVDKVKFNELDAIYHLGIPSSSLMYKNDKMLVGEAINDFLKILELAKIHKAKIVYASTSSLYNGNPIPWKESMNIKVTDFYTETRYTMERIAKLYYDLYGVKSVGLRFFSVYGKKEESKGNYANLVSQFLWSMKKGERPVIYGGGEQTRDFVFAKDAVKACILAMDSSIENDIFNVGTGKNHSLNEVVKMLNGILRTSIEPEYVDNPIENYVYHTLADTKRAWEKLNFKAKISLENGMKMLLGGEDEE